MQTAYVRGMCSSFVHLLRGLLIVLVMCGFAAPALALTSTTTTLTLSPASPVGKGQTVVLTATVVGASPTGNVTFMNGATNLGSRSLTSGSATLSVPFNAKGTFSLTAVYAGDSNNATSTSAAKSLTVLNASTTTLSYSGTAPIGTGQGVTLTAAVSATSPTGTVSFYDGATSLGSGTIASGSATLATSFATAGSHSVTAVYNGDASNAGSPSAAQNINVITGTVSAISFSANPSISGQTVTITDTITGNNAGGLVTFNRNGTSLGTATAVAGVATLTKSFPTAGVYSITATYPGDSNNTASAAPAASINILKATTMGFTASPNPATTGQSITLNATVSNGTSPTDTVTFKDGSTTLANVAVSGSATAQYIASFAAAGVHSLTVTYNGDSVNGASTSGAIGETIVGTTTTALSSSNGSNPAGTGKVTTLTATVSGTGVTPSGSVSFKDGATTLGSATLSAGVATYNANFSTTGTHSVTAVYGGDTYNTTSTSAADRIPVITGSTVTLAANPSPAVPGQSITLTANIAGNSPSGSVTFYDGATSLGSGSVAAGKVILPVSFSVLGSHSLTAVYTGDANNTPGTSAAVVLPVLTATSNVMTATPNPVLVGQNVVFNDIVTGNHPTGLVSYYDGSTNITSGGPSQQVGGTTFSTIGIHNLTAVFAGDSLNAASTSAVFPLQVVTATTTTVSGSGATNIWGQGYTFTATVTGTNGTPAPSGSVSIYATGNANAIAKAAVYNGTAHIYTDFASCCAAGTFTFYAVYNGDNYNASSTSGNVSVAISTSSSPYMSFTPTTTVAAIGDTVGLHAVVKNAPSQGTVTFKDGATTLAQVNYSGAIYFSNFVPTTAGVHNLTATFNGVGGDTSTITASVIVNVTSTVASDTLSVSGSTTVAAGQNVTFNAVLAGNSPSGNVTFYDGGAILGTVTIANGQASYATSFAAGGVHNITAAYTGDLQNGNLNSNNVAVTVVAADSTTLAFSNNPAAVGQTIIATATVTASGGGVAPNASVTFSDNGTVVGSPVPLSGTQATYIFNYPAIGSHTITAAYSGDTYNAASSITAALAINTASQSTLTLNHNPAVQNEPVTLNVGVTGNNPGGSATFYDGGTSLGSATLVNGQASYVAHFATVGNHAITVAYGGDGNNAQSTSGAVSLGIISPINSVTADVNPAQATQIVNLTATIVGANPGGSVTFMDGATSLSTVTVSNGVAHLQTSFATTGIHNIVANYSGDANNPPSTTIVPLAETVNPAQAAPTVSLTSPSAGQVYVNAPASVSIQALASSPGTIAKVVFYNGSNLLGTVTSAPYKFTWTNVVPGTYSITAVATDNVGFVTSSAAVSVRVNSPPTVRLTSPVDGATFAAPGPTMNITADVGDSDGTVTNVLFMVSESGGPLQGLNGPSAPPYTITWNSVSAGDYTFYVQVTDNDGAVVTSAPVSVHSVVSSACLSVTPASGVYTSQTTGTLSGNSSTGFTTSSTIGMALAQMGVPAGTSASTTITPLGALGSFSGATANGITSSSAGAGCGMNVAVKPTITVQRTPSPMIAGAPFTMTATTIPAGGVNYSCAPNTSGSGGYNTAGGFESGQSVKGTANIAWVGNQSTCVWTAIGPGGTATYSESVTTNAEGSAPIVFNFTANGIAASSVSLPPDSAASQIAGRPEARVTFAGGASEVGATITSLQWSTGSGNPLNATLPMTLDLPDGTVITLIATDNFGHTATTSIRINVIGVGPSASLSTGSSTHSVAAGGTVPVTFSASASESGGTISNIVLMQSTGGGSYVEVPGTRTTVGAATGTQTYTVNLGAGSYNFELVATDSQNNSVTSAPVPVNITTNSVAGQIDGIRAVPSTITGNPATLQLYGWACIPGSSQAIHYQVYANAQAAQGGTLVADSSTLASGGAADLVEQSAQRLACGSTGHDILLDLTSIAGQYGSSPLYVQAFDAGNNSIALNCANCTMPGSMRIGLTTPAVNDTFVGMPATVFVRAKIDGATAPYTAVNFIVNGITLTGLPDTSPNTYYASTQLAPGQYTATAYVEQGSTTLYSTENTFIVVGGDGATVSLGNAAGNISLPHPLTATTGGTAISGATVHFYANYSEITSAANPAVLSNGVWSINWNGATAGSYQVYARIFDGNGVLQAQSAIVILNVTNATPTVLTALSAVPVPVAIAPAYLGNADAGSLPGNLSVGNNGAANYSIPIALPPGTAGLAPSLSLNYSSLAGNGLPGYGWSLSGGSSIHRCVKNVAQDGQAGPITLTTSDALCLDGKRLILVSGSYGQVNSTYRTEIDSFSRISMYTTANSLVAFKVETRDGKTMTYGSTADSSVQVVGKIDSNHAPVTITAPLFWDLATVTDLTVDGAAANNRIVYHYLQNSTTGEHLLANIQYGNSSTLYNSVVFTYECRNGAVETAPDSACAAGAMPTGDADIEYVAGARSDLRHRLTTITTYTDTGGNLTGGLQAQTTTLSYKNSAVSQRSLLTQVQTCGKNAQGVNTCLEPTVFTWGTASGTNSFVSAGLMTGKAPPQSGAEAQDSLIYGRNISNPGINYQKRIGSLITGDFYGDGKLRILTADHGEGNAGPAGWHIYTASSDGRTFDRADLAYSANTNLPTQFAFGVPDVTGTGNQRAYLNGSSIVVGDFDGDGAADIAFVDQDSSDLNVSGYLAGNRNGNINICLSRMATTGTFDCKVVAMPAVQLTSAQQTTFINAQFAAYPDGVPDEGPTNAMFLSTQANGRTDLLLYWTLDPSALTNQRCSYTPPTSSTADDWSWTCSQYAGIFSTMNTALGETAAPYLAALGNWWPVPRHAYPIPPSPITNNSLNAAVFPGIVVGDFIGAGLSSFIAQRPSAYPLGSGNNSDLYVAVANSSPINGVGLTPIIGGAQASPYVSPPVSSNQFIWSAGTAAQKQTAINRYFVRESRGTELGGTPLGDINGDGYTDYLMTFEGHAEICYSFGVDGFDCHLMEDQTPGWNPTTFNFPASVSTVASSTTIPSGITVAVDGQGLVPSNASMGLFGVYSVLSVGHASDSNLQEVIYRRGDGGNFASYQSNNGGPGVGGDQYYVCTVRDGMKNCIPWTGPNLRPPASGSDNVGYPIPGVAFNPTKGAIAWPNAGHMVGDFTGQGRTQILWYCDSQCSDANPVSGAPTQVQAGQGWQLFMPNVSGSIDRLMSVRNGNGNTSSVDYAPMSRPSVYTAQANDLVTGQPIPVTYPLQRTVDNGRMLASAIHTDDGNGSLTSYYQYHGLTSDVTGRGEQGFAIVTVTNPQGTTASTQYAQGFPYTGMVLATTLMSSTGTLMEQVDNRPLTSVSTVAATGNAVNAPVSYPMPIAGHIYCSYAPTSTVQRHDLNGVATTQTITTINNADAYCNVINSTATTTALNNPALAYSTITANTINNFTASGQIWIVGQIAQAVVTRSEPISDGINAAQANIARTKAFSYYANGSLQSETIEPGNATLSVKTFFDRNPSSTCSSTGNVFGLVNCTVQSWHDPVANVDTSRMIKSVTYDPQGRFTVAVTNGLGQIESHAYDDTTGAQIRLTNPNALSTIWSADGFGRMQAEIRSDHTQINTYRKLCRATISVPNPTACPVIFGVTPATVMITDNVTDATLGGVRTSTPELVFVDSAGHPVRSQKYGFAGGEIDTDVSYDLYGRLAVSYQPTFAGTDAVKASSNGYDELSRVTTIVTTDESGFAQTTRTDFNGLSVTVTNPKNESKTEIRDPLGRVEQSVNTPNDGVNSPVNTWFAFDAWGDLVQTKDQLGNIVTIGYDNLGRKTGMHDPDLGNISYSIDPRGLQYSQTSARGFVTTYAYDPLDRMITRNESDLVSTWVYDQPAGSGTNPAVCAAAHSCGKLIESKSLLGSVTDYDRLQTYDSLGRASVTTTTLDTVYTNTAYYDSWGRPSYRVTVRGALSKTFGQRYNQYGYLAQAVRTTGTADQVLWEAEKQDAASRITNANLGNGVAIGRTFNVNTGRLTEGILDDKTGTQILEEGYVYDQVGNVTDRVQYWYPGLANQNGVAENFQYDGLNRLANSTVYGQPKQVFTYDAIGDITSKTGVGTYTYPTPGANAVRPHAVASISSLGSFSYDASGNMMTGAGRSYTNWTSFDMPVTITQGGASSTFVYGPEHQRTTQTKGDGSVIVYAEGMEVDTSASGVVTVKTYWSAGLGLDTDTLNASGASVANVQNWTHTDRLGSTIGLTDINGVPQEMLAYDAWGSRRNLNGTALTPGYVGKLDDHGYTGQEMLDQLGLVHMNGRVYDPLAGRFLSADPKIQDPMHSQSYNRYTYVWNNPTNLTDPTGFEAQPSISDTMHAAEGWTTIYQAPSEPPSASASATGAATKIRIVDSAGNLVATFTIQNGTGTTTGANASSTGVQGSGTLGADESANRGGENVPPPPAADSKVGEHPMTEKKNSFGSKFSSSYNESLLGKTIGIEIKDQDSVQDVKNLSAKIDDAIGKINAHEKSLTQQQKETITKINKITVHDDEYTGVTQATGVYNMRSDYLKSDAIWIASTIAHDSFHILQYQRQDYYKPETAPRLEREADNFQIEVGKKLGLTDFQIKYLETETHTRFNINPQ